MAKRREEMENDRTRRQKRGPCVVTITAGVLPEQLEFIDKFAEDRGYYNHMGYPNRSRAIQDFIDAAKDNTK